MLRVYLRGYLRCINARRLGRILRNWARHPLPPSRPREEQWASGHLQGELRCWFLCLRSNRLGCCQGARKCTRMRIVLTLRGFVMIGCLCIHEAPLLLWEYGIILIFSRDIHRLFCCQGFWWLEDDQLKDCVLYFYFWLFFRGFFVFTNVLMCLLQVFRRNFSWL